MNTRAGAGGGGLIIEECVCVLGGKKIRILSAEMTVYFIILLDSSSVDFL